MSDKQYDIITFLKAHNYTQKQWLAEITRIHDRNEDAKAIGGNWESSYIVLFCYYCCVRGR